MDFQLRTAIVTGRNHILDGRNCQDALYSLTFEIDGQSYLVGVIADGCGAGQHSEVGAQLAVQYVPYALRSLFQHEVELEDMPVLLFGRLIHFLKSVIDNYSFASTRERVQFVHNHLLFTLLGFVLTPTDTLIFAAGDGIILINDVVHLREQNNTPAYIGYHLLDQQYLQTPVSALPTAFDLYHIPYSTLHKLAIGSDAWLQEQPLLEHIWGLSGVAGLQLQLNRWSNARHLKDDASLLVLERIPQPETGEAAWTLTSQEK
jgi:hypothetical protein